MARCHLEDLEIDDDDNNTNMNTEKRSLTSFNLFPIYLILMCIPSAFSVKFFDLIMSYPFAKSSFRSHGYLSVVSVVCCQVEVPATS